MAARMDSARPGCSACGTNAPLCSSTTGACSIWWASHILRMGVLPLEVRGQGRLRDDPLRRRPARFGCVAGRLDIGFDHVLAEAVVDHVAAIFLDEVDGLFGALLRDELVFLDRKSTRLNSSH